jgi:hypothetical protein
VGFVVGSYASDYYVAPNGLTENPGSLERPFASIQEAVNIAQPGDRIYLRAGHYNQQVVVSNKRSIEIMSYPGEWATLDGSVQIDDIALGDWTLYRDDIYKRILIQDIWQLFLDRELVTIGRWPDADFDDGSIWSRDAGMKPWSYGDHNGNGTATFAALKGFPESGRYDFLEGVAILNYHHWLTAAKGLRSIDWSTGKVVLQGTLDVHGDKAGYFFGLGCIDHDNEWWYDNKSMTLYYRAPGGIDPSAHSGTLQGRVLDYGITFNHSFNVTLKNIDFFSCSIAVDSNCESIIIDTCRFLYPNDYKFMLGVYDWPKNEIYADPSANNVSFIIRGRQCVLKNSEIAYSNTHIFLTGPDMLVENNWFHDIEWDVVSSGGSGTLNLGTRMRFHRNRVFRCGNSEGVRPNSGDSDIEISYNHLSQMSLLQVDGAAINCSLQAERNHVHHNWVHDSQRAAIRWDWWPAGVEKHGSCFHHNVTWDCPIWQIKNDHNVLFNNVGTKNASVYFYDWEGGYNDHSVAINNLTQKMFRQGHLLRSNMTENGNEFDLLHDWQQYDFRPALPRGPLVDTGSTLLLRDIPGLATHAIPVPSDGDRVAIDFVGSAPDIGAYEYGADEYWIPGPKASQASMPIPSNGALSQPLNRDLIYLIGYQGVSASIHFGTSPNHLLHVTDLTQPSNVVVLGELGIVLEYNTTYYWRVDTILSDHSVLIGDIWHFSTRRSSPRGR